MIDKINHSETNALALQRSAALIMPETADTIHKGAALLSHSQKGLNYQAVKTQMLLPPAPYPGGRE